ncbi:MAG: ATP-binding cassette domain-containing protein [Bifidobacteriaceae bacterium]|nr:ATP-binding cassette domain-containing protein [Bifidobacteriaceae bacterium]
MTAAVAVVDLVKRYRRTLALDHVSVEFEEGLIHGLFGHNGAGKTTLMAIITAQVLATSGQTLVYGRRPYEHAPVLERMCFIREGQGYPNDARARDAFMAARMFYPRWDQSLADYLIEALAIPLNHRVRRMSRGQNSAVGVTIGLAARADITFFDEPYLGLDAMARQVFYETLAASYARDPRTIVLSSHLIDEVAPLVANVVVLDHARVLIDQDRGSLLGRAARVIGPSAAVADFARGRVTIGQEAMGPYLALTVMGPLSSADQSQLAANGLTVEAVSLQQLVIHLTRRQAAAAGSAPGAGTGAGTGGVAGPAWGPPSSQAPSQAPGVGTGQAPGQASDSAPSSGIEAPVDPAWGPPSSQVPSQAPGMGPPTAAGPNWPAGDSNASGGGGR